MGFADPLPRQTRQHFVEHPPRQPQPSITGIDHQVLEVTTATVMPGHQAGDHLPFGFDQQAQPGVALTLRDGLSQPERLRAGKRARRQTKLSP